MCANAGEELNQFTMSTEACFFFFGTMVLHIALGIPATTSYQVRPRLHDYTCRVTGIVIIARPCCCFGSIFGLKKLVIAACLKAARARHYQLVCDHIILHVSTPIVLFVLKVLTMQDKMETPLIPASLLIFARLQ